MATIHRQAGAARPSLARLRGAARLAIEATTGVAEVVEAMHRSIGSGPAVLGRPLELPTRLLTAPVYRAIRAITQVVGAAVDAGLGGAAAALASTAPEERAARDPDAVDAVVAALNGVVGDHLAASGNPLAVQMGLVHEGRVLELEDGAADPLPHASRGLLVLVHGACMSDRCWSARGLGAALARDLGVTPVHVRYNSGLHISVNGRSLAELLERLVRAHPAADGIALVGHSMGGLVSRSACHLGELRGHAWRRKLRKLICLASPHHGAPLERGGHWVEVLLGVSRYSRPLAALGRLRSAGVTDLRFGNVLEEHWAGMDRFAHGRGSRSPLPLPAGVDCYAVAASRSPPGRGRLRGDGLVSVESALGRHRDPARTLAFPAAHQWVAHGTGHLDLLGRAEVFEKLRSWLAW